MTTPITYYGGKQRLADTIISLIPPHRIYCEPFFGGGAVFFRKRKSYLEAINDKNDLLINFYQVVQNNFDELKCLVDNSLLSERMFLQARDFSKSTNDQLSIEKAWAIWYLTNNSYAGKMISGGFRWCNGTAGSHSGRSLAHKRHDFTRAIADRLAEVQITCRDALTCIADRDTTDTFFYLDPPYPGSDQGHYAGYTFDHFRDLLDLLTKVKGRFILSNFDSPMLREYVDANGWTVVRKEMPLTIANRIYAKRKIELLVLNYPRPNILF